MTIVLLLIAAFLVFVLGIWITFSLLGLLVTLVIAFLAGWVADKILPGRIPYGWVGAIVFGLLGSLVGGLLLGDAGPEIGGIAIFPAIVGAVILAFLADLVFKTSRGQALRQGSARGRRRPDRRRSRRAQALFAGFDRRRRGHGN